MAKRSDLPRLLAALIGTAAVLAALTASQGSTSAAPRAKAAGATPTTRLGGCPVFPANSYLEHADHVVAGGRPER